MKPTPLWKNKAPALASEETITNRWWEFYLVRYGAGTVIGGIIFFFLCTNTPALKPLLLGAGEQEIETPHLLLLAGYGLGYCYIASAPILTLHATRFLLEFREHRLRIDPLLLFSLGLAFSGGFFLFIYLHGAHHIDAQAAMLYALVATLVGLFFWPQLVMAVMTLYRIEQLFRFYQNLDVKRSRISQGLVDSYKHLREHGNAFSIVLLELVFALPLYLIGRAPATGEASINTPDVVIHYTAVLIIWIFPSALIWLVGTALEREIANN